MNPFKEKNRNVKFYRISIASDCLVIPSKTTWDKPEGFEPSQGMDDNNDYEESQPQGDESPIRASSPIIGEDQPPTPEPEEPMEADATADDDAVKEEEPEEPEIDPAIQRLEEARAALKQTDAIMEPGSYHFTSTSMIAQDTIIIHCMILDRLTIYLCCAKSTNRCFGSCYNSGNQ